MLTDKQLEDYKGYYASRLWSTAMLEALLRKKRITKAEYEEIKAARED